MSLLGRTSCYDALGSMSFREGEFFAAVPETEEMRSAPEGRETTELRIPFDGAQGSVINDQTCASRNSAARGEGGGKRSHPMGA